MLKVVGWIDNNYDFRESNYSEEEIEAIINDIRENGYSFCGDEQEHLDNGTPVLSNGRITHFSWRGWGGVMARAYNMTVDGGGYNYILWYMKDVGPRRRIYPVNRHVNFDQIETGFTHSIKLTDSEYEAMKSENVWNLLIPQEYKENEKIYYGDIVNLFYKGELIYSFKVGNEAQIFHENFLNEFIPDNQFKGKTDVEIKEEFIKRYPYLKDKHSKYVSLELSVFKAKKE